MIKEDLLIELYHLAIRINSHGGKMEGDSMVERYKGFVERSESGTNCVYARKCKDLFMNFDYDDILAQLKKVLKCIVSIEGVDCICK